MAFIVQQSAIILLIKMNRLPLIHFTPEGSVPPSCSCCRRFYDPECFFSKAVFQYTPYIFSSKIVTNVNQKYPDISSKYS